MFLMAILCIYDMVRSVSGYSKIELADILESEDTELSISEEENIRLIEAESISVGNPDLISLLDKYTKDYQLEIPLIMAIMKIESNFDPKATSPVGACGLMQLMPETAREMGLTVNINVDERLDPAKNMEAGIRYMKHLMDMFGNPVEAVAAYNMGPKVIKEKTPSNTETLQHVYKVIRLKYEYENNTELIACDMNLMMQKCKPN
jgi:soluble lytic murein transglycosylase-like protein